MKHLLPNFNGSSAPTKSSTFKHLDVVFSALNLFASFLNLVNIKMFLTALQTSYQRVCYMVNINPAATIAELKRVRSAYIGWIRGGPVPTVRADVLESPDTAGPGTDTVVIGDPTPEVTAGLTYIHEENILSTLVIQSIVDYRLGLPLDFDKNAMWLMDIIVIGFLSLHRVISIPAKHDWSSLTNPHNSDYAKEVHTPSGKGEPTVMGSSKAELTRFAILERIDDHLKEFGWSVDKFAALHKSKCRSQQFFIISSAGPNGNATWTAASDAIALIRERHVLNSLNLWCRNNGLKRFMRALVNTVKLRNVDMLPDELLKTGRIHTFDEWGGKTRNVAIVDYWTQVCLTPLHDTIFEVLKTLETDATFDQDAAAETIRKWTAEPGAQLYSFDLTAATDRLPVSFQARILNKLLKSTDSGHHWANLLVGRNYINVEGDPIKYAVGAPMGSKSNWAMLALVHHIIVWFAAGMCGQKGFKRYRICGDDIVIGQKNVADNYRDIITYLGLEISESKSIIHRDKLAPAAEFCQRVFISGREYTVFPVKLIAKTAMNGRLLPQLQTEVTKRGMTLPGSDLYSWLAALTDKQSAAFLAMLNTLPLSISGLKSTITLPEDTQQMETWYPHYALKSDDLVQGYTYVASTEQLKRLDALLRQTVMVSDTIAASTAVAQGVWPKDFEATLGAEGKPFMNLMREHLTDMSLAHPIVQASQREAIRVSLMLTQISNATMEMAGSARKQLLDMFRNSLVSMWDDKDAALAQADRTLITKTLDSLETMLTKYYEGMPKAEMSRAYTSVFSTKLQHFERNWTVRWELGSPVTINTVKARIVMSAEVAKESAKSASAKLPIRRADRV